MNSVFFIASLIIFVHVSAFAQESIQAPRAISNPDPVYPAEAANLGYGGSVVVYIKVDKKGKVSVKNAFGPNAPCKNLADARVENIRMAVVEAAKKSEFEPPLKDGKPTDIEMVVTYMFDKAGKPTHLRDPNDVVEVGVLQGRVKHLARPDYPASARATRASGWVPVSVLVDTDGKIIAASAIGGHPLLRDAAVYAACSSSIEPVALKGVPVQVTGVISYQFMP